jgi:glutathione S-transferase
MALTLYGSPQSRTMRSLWVLAELELNFTLVSVEWDDPALKAPAFLALNSAGTIPTLVDDGVVVAESMAIALYLTRRYGDSSSAALYPTGAQAEADVWRWTLWAQGHLESWVQQDARLTEMRAEFGPAVQAEITKSLTTLESALVRRAWLSTGHFTVADLNVASVLSPSRAKHLMLMEYPAISDWLERCYGRPAALASRLKYGSARATGLQSPS